MTNAEPYYALTRSGRLMHIADERRYMQLVYRISPHPQLRSYCGRRLLGARPDENRLGTVCARCRKGWELTPA